MTLANLSLVIFVLAIVLFTVSQFSRRQLQSNTKLKSLQKVLSAIVLVLVLFYFYKRVVA